MNHGPSITNHSATSGRLDGHLKGRAQEWLTRKLALGFMPVPQSEEGLRQRFHTIRELYADGAVVAADLWKVPPHERTGKDRELCERLGREVEETRVQQEELRARAGIDALIAAGPPSTRVTLERSPHRLEVQIAPWRNGALSLILPIWLLVAGMIWMNGLLGIFGRGPMPWGPLGGLLVGVPFSFLLYFSTLYWLWIQGGTETVTVDRAGLRVQGALLRWYGERTFPLDQVEHLRYSRPPKGEAWDSVVVGPARVAAPSVAFYSEGKTWRFGTELDDVSALAVIAAVEDHIAKVGQV